MQKNKTSEWINLTTNELDALDRKRPVIFPIGSIEAHGQHLPLITDSGIAETIARKACERTEGILLPPLYYAYLGAPKRFVGGINIPAELCGELLKAIVRCVFESGFTKMILYNGHASNKYSIEIALRALLDELEQRGLKIQALSWWDDLPVRVRHACEVETAMAVAALGENVLREDKIKDNIMKYPGWRVNDWHKLAPDSGSVNGNPSKFREQDGAGLIKTATEKLVSLINDAHKNW